MFLLRYLKSLIPFAFSTIKKDSSFAGYMCACIYIHTHIYMYVYVHMCTHVYIYVYNIIYNLYVYCDHKVDKRGSDTSGERHSRFIRG